jgi:uncharacterized RDD family membrane protein YckC
MDGDPRPSYPTEIYAGFWRRVLAALIDSFLIMLLFALPVFLLLDAGFLYQVPLIMTYVPTVGVRLT